MFIAGVDDAGRGPIIGPMVLAGVKVKAKDLIILQDMGCKDSKLLTQKKREELFDKIHELAKQVCVSIAHPGEIDEALRSETMNLNSLEALHFTQVINDLKPNRAIIDCPSPNIAAYTQEIQKQLTCDAELVCEHKADFNHSVVAAASIIAKVTRDRIIEEIKQEHGDFGSGYLSDPKTKAFLDEHWQTKSIIFRQTWAPYRTKLLARQQSSLSDF